jgi:uncharacterized protein YndB with AHSA1/START domain
MPREFELRKDVALDATPEQVWEAIATGPGITAWFMPYEVEPGAGGVVRLRFDDVVVDESTITAWDPPHRLLVVGGAEDRPHTFEYLVEAREGGSAVLRFVQTGFLGEDWESEYEAMNAGWDMYFHTLNQYLVHFDGRRVTFVGADGPEASASEGAWAVLLAALGLDHQPVAGARVQLTGPTAIDGVVDYALPTFLGVRTADALYRFHGRASLGMSIGVGHHLYAADVDQKETEAAWQSWLERTFTP